MKNAKDRMGSEFSRLPRQYRTVPFRISRGTVLLNRTADRTFLTVFRDFCLKARTQPRFKYTRLPLKRYFFTSANRIVPKHKTIFVILTLKTLI